MTEERVLKILLSIIVGLVFLYILPKDYFSPIVESNNSQRNDSKKVLLDKDFVEAVDVVQKIINDGEKISSSKDIILEQLKHNTRIESLNNVFYENVYSMRNTKLASVRTNLAELSSNVYERAGNRIITVSLKENAHYDSKTGSIRFYFPNKYNIQNVYSIKLIFVDNKWVVDGDEFYQQNRVASSVRKLMLEQ